MQFCPSNQSRHPFQLLDFTFLVAPLLDCTLWVGTSLFWLHLYWPPSPSNLSRHQVQALLSNYWTALFGLGLHSFGCTSTGLPVQATCPGTHSNYLTSLFWLHLYWTALYYMTTVEIHSFPRCFRSTIKIWKIATILYHTELEYIRLLRRELFR